jgi:hypothetical protein
MQARYHCGTIRDKGDMPEPSYLMVKGQEHLLNTY